MKKGAIFETQCRSVTAWKLLQRERRHKEESWWCCLLLVLSPVTPAMTTRALLCYETGAEQMILMFASRVHDDDEHIGCW